MAGTSDPGSNDRNRDGFVARFFRAADDKLIAVFIGLLFGSVSFVGSVGWVHKDPTIRAEAYTSTMAKADNLRHDTGIKEVNDRVKQLEEKFVTHNRKAEKYIEKILRLEHDCEECMLELKDLRELMYNPYHQGVR